LKAECFSSVFLRRLSAWGVLVTLMTLAGTTAAREQLKLRYQGLELPGAPAAIIAADVNGDGLRDLAAVVVYTVWEQIGIEEQMEMDEVEGLMELLTIVPALFDHRELFVFLGGEDGTYRPAGEPLPLEASILAIEAGPPGTPIVALTDTGISILRPAAPGSTGPRFLFEPYIQANPVLAGTATFVPRLGLVRDLDGDGTGDLLFPSPEGFAAYLTTADGLSTTPASLLPLPVTDDPPDPQVRHYPLPEIRDVNGDGRPDVLFPHHQRGWEEFHLALNLGRGRFQEPMLLLGSTEGTVPAGDGYEFRVGGPAEAPEAEEASEEDQEGEPSWKTILFTDLDGDGRAEFLRRQEVDQGAQNLRQELAEAKNPLFNYRLFRQRPDHSQETEAFAEFTAEGHALDGGDQISLPGGFQDLDGDGDQDLVTLTLDFSLLQAVKVLATRRVGIGLDFHIWCQELTEDGHREFRRVPGLDLSGKFTFDLNQLRIGQLSQFRGDFDGDGRLDFIQMGRGKKVTIHRGRDDCFYPPNPDLSLTLEEEPQDLSLIQVRDLDGDELSDILVIHPLKAKEAGTTPPVRLDLYLSGGPR